MVPKSLCGQGRQGTGRYRRRTRAESQGRRGRRQINSSRKERKRTKRGHDRWCLSAPFFCVFFRFFRRYLCISVPPWCPPASRFTNHTRRPPAT